MAKRVYTPKVQPIAVQIHIQRANIAQCEAALEQAQQMASQKMGFGGFALSESETEQRVEVVAIREQQLAAAQQRLADLEAQVL